MLMGIISLSSSITSKMLKPLQSYDLSFITKVANLQLILWVYYAPTCGALVSTVIYSMLGCSRWFL